ncbi:MAG: OmpH family outer membrane protein [Tannerella sp.]|jgi:outer membrane protein|nr:OmpH family outer membrane protein [Tannerella sp.]
MYKKIVLFALMMIPVTLFAQETQRIAYVNYQEVTSIMPEVAQLSDSLRKTNDELVAEIKGMQEEYTAKMTDFLEKRDTLAESIRIRRQQDIADYQERIQNFEGYASEVIAQLQRTLAAPIQDKVQKAINDVATENHYTYVLNYTPEQNILLFVSPKGIDATPLVKAKLGLK